MWFSLGIALLSGSCHCVRSLHQLASDFHELVLPHDLTSLHHPSQDLGDTKEIARQ